MRILHHIDAISQYKIHGTHNSYYVVMNDLYVAAFLQI